jgi:putative FmdB family regulatory protein
LPTYEYRCRKGHTFEVIQSMSDDPITACTECRAPVERVFHPVAVHFKGSGFYTTDYGRKRSGAGGDSAGVGEKSGDGEKGGGGGKADKETAGAKSDSTSDSSKKSDKSD